jgi:peptidoglycan hydrolase CwlO-like protein
MRNTGEESSAALLTETYRETSPRKKRRGAFFIFAIVWLVLIASGVTGAKWYSERIQNNVTADIERQTSAQIALMQQDYDARLTKLEAGYKEQLTKLEGKIQALNELLTFTKDNMDTKTDNSNKLYTQLAEVKKQLNELKKSLDVLK